MTQEDINIIVDCIQFGAPAYSGRILDSLRNHLKEFNKYKKFYLDEQNKKNEQTKACVECDTVEAEEHKGENNDTRK